MLIIHLFSKWIVRKSLASLLKALRSFMIDISYSCSSVSDYSGIILCRTTLFLLSIFLIKVRLKLEFLGSIAVSSVMLLVGNMDGWSSGYYGWLQRLPMSYRFNYKSIYRQSCNQATTSHLSSGIFRNIRLSWEICKIDSWWLQ